MDNGSKYYQQFLDGDNDAFSELVEQYRIPIQMFLFSIVSNMDIAEDIVIEVFVKLITKKPRYNGKSSFKTWIFAISRNLAIDYIRKNKKHESVSFEAADKEISSTETPEDFYFTNEQNRQLNESMQKLKHEYYSALWLMYFENLSVKEIARILNKSESNTKTLLSRARATLKNQLEKDGFSYEI